MREPIESILDRANVTWLERNFPLWQSCMDAIRAEAERLNGGVQVVDDGEADLKKRQRTGFVKLAKAEEPPSAHLPNIAHYEHPKPPPEGFPVLEIGPIPDFPRPEITSPPGVFDGSTWDGVTPRVADCTARGGRVEKSPPVIVTDGVPWTPPKVPVIRGNRAGA